MNKLYFNSSVEAEVNLVDLNLPSDAATQATFNVDVTINIYVLKTNGRHEQMSNRENLTDVGEISMMREELVGSYDKRPIYVHYET